MTLQAVALDRYPLPERGLVASILVQHAGLPEPVAAKLAQRAAGIVWENAPQAAAEQWPRHSRHKVFRSRTIPQTLRPNDWASAARRVLSSSDGEHLGIPLKYNGPPEVGCVERRAGRLVRSVPDRKEADDRNPDASDPWRNRERPAGAGRCDAKHRGRSVRGSPGRSLAALARAASSHEFNYALTLGGTIHESWREKFAVLVAKLGLRAERALISPQTEALLAAGMTPQNCDGQLLL